MSPLLGIWASQITGRLWEPQGAYDALATVNVPSGGLSTITFAGIPTGYKHLQVRALFQNTNGDRTVLTRFNGDSGNNYSYHWLYGLGSGSGSAYAVSSTSSVEGIYNWQNAGTFNSAYFVTAIIDVLDYASVNKNKTVRTLYGVDYNGGGQVGMNSGAWYSTAAINSITLTPNLNSFVQYSQFALYGVK